MRYVRVFLFCLEVSSFALLSGCGGGGSSQSAPVLNLAGYWQASTIHLNQNGDSGFQRLARRHK